MSNSIAAESPALAPPGAGLPKVELFVARVMFAVARRVRSRDSLTARFFAERVRIAELYSAQDEPVLRRRVLIRRLPGMEDSSRHWSVYMTLDHLRIVNNSIALTIAALVRGHTPPGEASTAAVKPTPDCGPEVVAPYEASCDAILAQVQTDRDLRTAGRYAHPWFGPLDAAGWHAMAGGHMGIHRKQIERILAGG